MPYLIDGSNLIGHIPGLEISDLKSKQRLVRQLFLFQSVKKTKIILVFDGHPDPELIGKKFQRKEFSLLWPDSEDSADPLIERLIEQQTDLRHFYVVSSDREIQSFARKNKAKVLDCGEFHKLMKKVLKELKEDDAMEKEESELSPLEMDHWLSIFGASDE